MNALVLAILIIVANVLGAGMIVPQAMRLHRTRSTDGVSAAWVGVGIVMNLWWIVYAISGSVWGVLPVSVVAGVLYVAMGVQFLRLIGRAALTGMFVGGVSIGLVPLVALVIDGWSLAGVAIGLCYGIQFAPAVVQAVRSVSAAGISPVTWSMAWGEAVIWITYGSVISDPALLVGGLGGAVMATIILIRLAADRAGRQRTYPVALS